MISIVVISKNEGQRLKDTVDSLLRAKCKNPFEIIVVDDGSTDESSRFLGTGPYAEVLCIHTDGLGIAAAKNKGAEQAGGEVLAFCDAHILVEDGWLDVLISEMGERGAQAANPAIVPMKKRAGEANRAPFDPTQVAGSGMDFFCGCGKSFRNFSEGLWLPAAKDTVEVPVLSSICMVIEKAVFYAVGGFGIFFEGYGWEEEELSMKLWMFGYTLIGVPKVRVQHLFRQVAPYQIPALSFVKNLIYLAACHYADERIAAMRAALPEDPVIDVLFQEILSDPDVLKMRKWGRDRRVYDDDWYVQRFSLPI